MARGEYTLGPMTGRTILITGCSSGIGEACALGMKARGWRVFATARRPADIQRLKRAGVEALALDYTKPKTIATCADEVLERTGGQLDALFNNGGYGQPGAVEDVPVEAMRTQFEANLFGWHDLTRRVIPAMRAQGSGRIVQNSSCLGVVALAYRGAYCASKYAVEALADAMRQELKGSGVHVSLIEPGPIYSRFVEHALAAYKANIDLKNSAHAAVYERRVAAMERGGSNAFKLPPEAVLKKLVHAVESSRPRARYRVTVPATLLALGKRLLTTRQLDFFTAGQ